MEKLNKIQKKLNKIYYLLFKENHKGKLNFNFPQDYFRWDMIEYLIKKNNYKKYLEIGCDQNQLFSRINIQNKVGVDPASGGNVRETSDNFFEKNKLKFDVIYIDGYHKAFQVIKDFKNSWEILNKNGVLIFDDYIWQFYSNITDNPCYIINSYLKEIKNKYKIIKVSNSQLFIQKL